MFKKEIISIIFCLAILSLTACGTSKENDTSSAERSTAGESTPITQEAPIIASLSLADYPKIGSTEFCLYLNQNLFKYKFEAELGEGFSLDKRYPVSSKPELTLLWELRQGETDLVFLEKLFGDEKFDESLTYTYLGFAAVCFFTSSENPANSVGAEYLRDAYMGNPISWQLLGGEDANIELPSSSVPKNATALLKKTLALESLSEGSGDYSASGNASVNYIEHAMLSNYLVGQTMDSQYRGRGKLLSVEGVAPTVENAKCGAYPFTYKVYAVTRKDIGKDSPAQKITDWLACEQSADGMYGILPISGIFLPDAVSDFS